METRWFLRLNRYFIHSSRGRESRKDTEKTPFTSDVSQLQVRGLSVEFQTQMKNTQRRDKTTGLKHEKTFFFFETESNNHSLTTASEFRRKVKTTGGEQAVESYREKFGFLQSSSLFFSESEEAEGFSGRGRWTACRLYWDPDASRKSPGGHPGVRASSGGQRPGDQEHQGWSVEQGLPTNPGALSHFYV